MDHREAEDVQRRHRRHDDRVGVGGEEAHGHVQHEQQRSDGQQRGERAAVDVPQHGEVDLQVRRRAHDEAGDEQAALGDPARGLPVPRDVRDSGRGEGAHDDPDALGVAVVPAVGVIGAEPASGQPGVLGTATHWAARSRSRCTTCSAAASESLWIVVST